MNKRASRFEKSTGWGAGARIISGQTNNKKYLLQSYISGVSVQDETLALAGGLAGIGG